MAAVIDLSTARQLSPVEIFDRPTTPARPALRLIEGGVSQRLDRRRRVYLRRRLVVLTVAVVLVVILLQGFGTVVSALLPSTPAASTETYTVGSGDTLWDVAGRVAPSTDRRATVDSLVALNGSAPLRVGQRLVLPASAG